MNSKGVKKGFFEGLAYPYHLIACYTVSQIRRHIKSKLIINELLPD